MLLYRLLLVSSFVMTILGAKIGRGEDEGDTEADQEIEDTEDTQFNLGDLKSPPV